MSDNKKHKTALSFYKSLESEFICGSPRSTLNKKCKTTTDLNIFAMEKWAEIKVKEYYKSIKPKQ